jgi:replicative DNA helicase
MPQEQGLPIQLPPQNPEAERSVLGSMLRDNEIITEIVQNLRSEHFYNFAHRLIFEAITTLYVDRGQPADLITLANFLNESKTEKGVKHLDEVGGPKYLADLWDAAPVVGNAVHYAEIIRQKAIVRFLLHTCNELQRDAYDQSVPAQELLDSAERRIMEIAEKGLTGETKTLQDALNEAYTRLDARKARGHMEYSGIPTGFLDLDNLTAGLQNSELIILAARPSVGKTAFALNLLRHMVVDEGIAALFVSLEQARVEIAERLLCCQSRVNSHHLRKGILDSEEMERLIAGGELLRQGKLFIDDTPGQNMLRIAANARRLKLRHNIRIVVIDYLQLIDPDDKRDSRQEQVAAISRRLKFLARELDIPVIALAQVNRSSEDRQDHRPRLSDLRESGAIEQDADTVMLLHRSSYHEPGQYSDQDQVEVIVGKQRNGPTGEVTLVYDKKYMRFENFAVEHSAGFGSSI